MKRISRKRMLCMKTLSNSCLKPFQLKQHLNNAHKDQVSKLIEQFKSKKIVSNVSGWMQEVHITKQIFPSYVVAFRIANSKKSHYCRNTRDTMPSGLCQNSSVHPRIILSWPKERTLSPNGYDPQIKVWPNDAMFSNKLACPPWMTGIFSSKECLLLLSSTVMAEIKYLLTQDVRTAKQARRQVRDRTSIPLVNRTFKLYPCGWSVKQEKKAVLQLT